MAVGSFAHYDSSALASTGKFIGQCCSPGVIQLRALPLGTSVSIVVRIHIEQGSLADVVHSETAAEENSTSYFPLLDRIAEGTFEHSVTEKELYDRFLEVLQEDGHIIDQESLSSFKLALAIRSAAPRIEAHYQFYNTSVQPSFAAAQDAACPVWAHSDGKQYCSSSLERAQQDVEGEL